MTTLIRLHVALLLGVLLLFALPALAVPPVFNGAVLRGDLTTTGKVIDTPVALSCASDGAGTAAACTLLPTSTLVNYTCSDTDGCAMTLSETGAKAGQRLVVINSGSNAMTFADSAGVQELPASISLAITESASFVYAGTAWVQSGPGTTTNTATAFTVSGGTITGANSETLNIGSTDATFKLARNDTGIVTLTAADNDATAALTVLPGGAAAMVLGGASTTSLTVTTDGTGTGEVVLPTGSIAAGEILDLIRAVQLPIAAWVPCTGQGIWTVDGTDTKPNLTAVNTALAITYDATGGSVDTGTICAAFLVPDDYVSGGAFVAQVTEGTATVTQVETWSCNVSLDGAALVGANAANLANQTAVQTVTSTPTVTYVAGKSVGVVCSQGNATADDVVNILGVRWTYTATE